MVICGEIGFTRNRAKNVIYQGLIGKYHVIIARATDAILFACVSIQAYEFIVTTVEAHGKVHNMRLMSHFFVGLRFVISRNCMIIYQTHLLHEVLTYVYGDSKSQKTLSSMNKVPMIAGIKHEEILAVCIPYDSEGLKHAMAKYGFACGRTLLGQFQHLCHGLVLIFKLLCNDWRNIKILLGTCIY
jgi:hypothetical protein